MGGRGEQVARQPVSRTWFVVVVPPIHCDTASIYARWDALVDDALAAHAGNPTLGENDLLSPALATHPELAPYHEGISSLDGLYHGMSGSGSSFYAAFGTPAAAKRAHAEATKRFADAAVFVSRSTESGHREGEGA
jgi:4-diphosphocytidyl-2C-methyl-D-erythritol kinase